MRAGFFLELMLISYVVYYGCIFIYDYSKTRKQPVGNTGGSPHKLSFSVAQAPVRIPAVENTENEFEKSIDNNKTTEQEKIDQPAVQKYRSTVVTDLGLEIISNGIEVSAENLSMLFS